MAAYMRESQLRIMGGISRDSMSSHRMLASRWTGAVASENNRSTVDTEISEKSSGRVECRTKAQVDVKLARSDGRVSL